MPRAVRDFVCFSASFRLSGVRGGVETLNVTHATLDGVKTLCGRSGWYTSEGWHDLGPDCRRCHRAWEKLPDELRLTTIGLEELQARETKS